MSSSEAAIPQWRNVKPHVPLSADDPAYVARPDALDVAKRITQLVVGRGGQHLLLGAPGVGKSTELARIQKRLGPGSVLIRLGQKVSLHRMTDRDLLEELAKSLAAEASPAQHMNVLTAVTMATIQERSLVDAVRQSVAWCTTQNGHCNVLLDGLERAPELVWRSSLDVLQDALPDAGLVAVVPLELAYGENQKFFGGNARIHTLRPFRLDGVALESQLLAMLENQLGASLPGELATSTLGAAQMSGGLPRTFLSLMMDAHAYGLGNGRQYWPKHVDLSQALSDMGTTLERLLIPGDVEKLRNNHKKSGSELSPGDRIRFLSHTLMLEGTAEGNSVLEIHPLLASAVGGTWKLTG